MPSGPRPNISMDTYGLYMFERLNSEISNCQHKDLALKKAAAGFHFHGFLLVWSEFSEGKSLNQLSSPE